MQEYWQTEPHLGGSRSRQSGGKSSTNDNHDNNNNKNNIINNNNNNRNNKINNDNKVMFLKLLFDNTNFPLEAKKLINMHESKTSQFDNLLVIRR